MDQLIARLRTADECEAFQKNALERNRLDLVNAARKRAVELSAIEYGAKSDAERECLEAVFAYEQILSIKNGKKTRASRTWPMIQRHGILGAVERAVDRAEESAGYAALVAVGLQDFAFEAVILRHSEMFSSGAVARAKERTEARRQLHGA